MARAAGFPVPLVISYGEHGLGPKMPPVLVSILMTRVPGKTLGTVHDSFSPRQRQTICEEMRIMLGIMRAWKHPWGDGRICSVMGTPIQSPRVPLHEIGPCASESDFNRDLICVASPHSYTVRWSFEKALARAKKINSMPHSIVFSHGHLMHHDIMVYDGHVSGFIDWESTGWLPEYWELTTATMGCCDDFWWVAFMQQAIGKRYLAEKDCERALMGLTSDSYLG
ncbi:hypothetical protein BU24DRAFT_345596 [Aaosphaeria arxii CBS 175.79]|uniref:Aminoglycoside phosphotransferase domain-containing protein n=1 Tax=Aaosphaeria arxii CBS 175.79 TaxID=1450172 RepID=A0A6A5XZ02_9PLEO|nr:uncharacterized protein BU24DRAFT_345596 [Aaosphaeria arxii CBS 175.79]KAF2017860.1 hypothetical protein BU24DRAFT_345596 [Aaosphaeria arxii CBS 175.79]